jgi:hypothetical protein
MITIQEEYGLSDGFLSSRNLAGSQECIAGAELEIESIRDFSSSWLADHGINVENDGSLRNGGKEFLLPPSTCKDLLILFKGIHSGILVKGRDPYSVRTSTHIHVNCLYSTPQQVKNLLLLYSIFEPLAFSYVGEERMNNIHCVPLNFTTIPNKYGLRLTQQVERWHKYTAFNLLPLRELGTVEFRHLGGTDDPEIFGTWLKFIETLWNVVHKEISDLGKNLLLDLKVLRSVQERLMTPDFIRLCSTKPDFVLENNLLDVKLAYL